MSKWLLILSIYLSSIFCSTTASAAYEYLSSEAKLSPAVWECSCLPGLCRSGDLKESLRGKLDRRATRYIKQFAKDGHATPLFFVGAGRLLNELTIVASALEQHLPLKVFLIDPDYALVNPNRYNPSSVVQGALSCFSRVCSELTEKFMASCEIESSYDLSYSVQNFIASEQVETIPAFFMIDVFYPASKAIDHLKYHIGEGLRLSKHPKASFLALFFILSKKDEGDYTPDCKYPNCRGGNPAVLEVYKVEIEQGSIQSMDRIYQKTQ